MKTEVFDLWPLMWWQNPWNVAGVGGITCALLGIAGYCVYRYVRRQRMPRSLREIIIMKLQALQQFPPEHDQERTCVYIELIHIMRDYAYHTFGIMHEGMTDVEFLKALDRNKIRDVAEQFVVLIESMSDEVSLAKFAARPVMRAVMEEHVAASLCYFQNHERNDREKYLAVLHEKQAHQKRA